jgi:hypothetical protein
MKTAFMSGLAGFIICLMSSGSVPLAPRQRIVLRSQKEKI